MLSRLSQTAARRRRNYLLLGALVLLFTLFAVYADNLTSIAGWLSALNAAVFSRLLALGLGFWLALRAAGLTRQAVYRLDDFGAVQGQIWRAAFDGGAPVINLQGGEVVEEWRVRPILRTGGPARVQIHLDSAAIIEDSQGRLSVLEPSSLVHELGSDERLVAVIDLRDHTLKLDLWARSKDGVRVRVDGARLVYSLDRGSRSESMQLPHPFELDAAIRLYAEQRVGPRAEQSHQPSVDTGLVAAEGGELYRVALQEFISEFHLGELLVPPGKQLDKVNPAELMLERDKLRNRFLRRVAQSASARGMEIHWIDLGSWLIDERALTVLGSEQTKGGEISENPYQDAVAETTSKLFDRVPQTQTDGESWLADALGGYAALFQQIYEEFPAVKGEEEGQLNAVRRFTRVLSKSMGGSR